MLKTQTLDLIISQYYDEEMNDSELLDYEARLAVSKGIREYTNRQCFEYFKISNSMKLVKNRAQVESKKLIIKKPKSVFDFYAVTFKRLNKRLRNLLLNIWRNNP